ncbi:hypothetical protein F383_35262 [Gossypium arboreum]|uniref:Uncharacterized protein n=1 Tax=Gossypium arboreum TaxID=29729 RepID=A0A0B0N8V1_GOSAR|nr:hypothetical protein F383_35262 [Gossypium arboreum]
MSRQLIFGHQHLEEHLGRKEEKWWGKGA